MMLLLTACSNFLEESSQDEVRPATVDDMEQLLIGEVYMEKINWNKFCNGYTDIMTDDKQCNGLIEEQDQSTLENGRYAYSWDRAMFDENGGGNDIFLWEELYKRIMGCNVVSAYLDKVTGDPVKRENLKGEALVMRGFYYFYLVNLFGMPYNYGNPTENPGVPLKLEMGVRDEYLSRNSVAEVYGSIEKDLLEGLHLLEENPVERDFLRAGALLAKALLCRMYLYMENWEKAIYYADELLREKSELVDLASIYDQVITMYPQQGVYNRSTPQEIIWARPGGKVDLNNALRIPSWGWSDNLAKCMQEEYEEEDGDEDEDDPGAEPEVIIHGDLRSEAFIHWGWDEYNDWAPFVGCIEKDATDGNRGVRVAEVYLNRAEAYIRLYMKDHREDDRVKALGDLNFLRRHRFNTRVDEYVDKDITDASELLEFYKNERRRELCGEMHHRWFDLRRYGMPEIKHLFWIKPEDGRQEFILPEKSSRYVLPIPEQVRKANPKLEPNL